MFSTPKKRLFELKKELRCVKKIMDKGNRKAIKTNYSYNQEIDKKFNVLVVRSEGI